MKKTRIIEYKYDENDIKDIRLKLMNIMDMIAYKESEKEIIEDKIQELMDEYFDL